MHYNAGMSNAPDIQASHLLPWEGRAVMLVDLDAFFASVEQLDHPAWRGKPVIVGGDADRHGVVSTCSYEARKFGVRSAMAASMAKKLCPEAIWTHGHFDRYRDVSNAIMGILRDETPHVQQVSIDEAFIDVSPTKTNSEHPILVARRIQSRVEALGVTCSIGLGTTKSVAKIASDMDKPRGLTVVYPGGESAFLSPLPIRIMSGIGPAAERTLSSVGIRTLGDLVQADASILRKVFGENAEMMRDRARGTDRSPVESDDTVKSVSNEVTYSTDLESWDEIQAALATIADKVGRRLRKKGLKGRALSVKVRFDDRSTKSAQCQLMHPTDDELLFTPAAQQLIATLWRPGLKIRLLGIGLSGFEEEAFVQKPLFDIEPSHSISNKGHEEEANEAFSYDFGKTGRTDASKALPKKPASQLNAEQRAKLLSATDLLKDRFGEKAVRFGHELRNEGNTTGSASKNPADYK